jgi:hypothetical protein
MDAFGPALAGADHIVLTDIYAAGEEPLPGVTLAALGAAVRRTVSVPVDLVPQVDDVIAAIARVAKPGDVVITLGAGSIGSVADRLVAALGGGASSAPAVSGGGTSSDRANLGGRESSAPIAVPRAGAELSPPDEDPS